MKPVIKFLKCSKNEGEMSRDEDFFNLTRVKCNDKKKLFDGQFLFFSYFLNFPTFPIFLLKRNFVKISLN